MAQCLRTVDDLTEDLGLDPRTHMEVDNSPGTPVQRDLTLFWLLCLQGLNWVRVHACKRKAHPHI